MYIMPYTLLIWKAPPIFLQLVRVASEGFQGFSTKCDFAGVYCYCIGLLGKYAYSILVSIISFRYHIVIRYDITTFSGGCFRPILTCLVESPVYFDAYTMITMLLKSCCHKDSVLHDTLRFLRL